MRCPTSACRLTVALALATLVSLFSMSRMAVAVHESTNTLVFEAVGGDVSSKAAGEGVIDYRRGRAAGLSVDGATVVQATRKGDGPGSITSARNDFSPLDVASPGATPIATPVGLPSPVASPSSR